MNNFKDLSLSRSQKIHDKAGSQHNGINIIASGRECLGYPVPKATTYRASDKDHMIQLSTSSFINYSFHMICKRLSRKCVPLNV